MFLLRYIIDRMAFFNLGDYKSAKQSFFDALQLDSKFNVCHTSLSL